MPQLAREYRKGRLVNKVVTTALLFLFGAFVVLWSIVLPVLGVIKVLELML